MTTTATVPVAPAIAVAVGPMEPRLTGLLLWTALTLWATALSVAGSGQAVHTLADTALIATAALGGPTAVAWVALIGTTEVRELRSGAPWWGLLASHAILVVAWAIGAAVMHAMDPGGPAPTTLSILAVSVGSITGLSINAALAGWQVAARTGRSIRESLPMPWRATVVVLAADTVISWLIVVVYVAGAWWSGALMLVTDLAAVSSIRRHRAEVELTRNALTELPNHRALTTQIRQLRRSHATGAAVLYLDLDGFKAVNDDHGHDAGDQVLRVTAGRLAAACRDRDFLAHLHGDEFVILAAGIDTEDAVRHLAARLVEAVEVPIALSRGTVRVSATVGHRLVSDLAALEESVKDADRVMNSRKAQKATAAGVGRRR